MLGSSLFFLLSLFDTNSLQLNQMILFQKHGIFPSYRIQAIVSFSFAPVASAIIWSASS